MRICLMYDCLFPHTVGGAERWYRNLAERLAADGHDVTYLTLRQWQRGQREDVPGVNVIAVGPRFSLYTSSGRRRILPPLVFGAGVLAYLLTRGHRFDVVHTASFPYFSLLAAGLVRPLHRFRLVVDWHEVWTRSYWRDYLGGAAGAAGWAVQRACLRLPQRAFCFSHLHARRLREEGVRGEVTVLEGEYEGALEPDEPRPPEPLVVFAGRHIPEKRAPALVPAIELARKRIPELRGLILGDGPERPKVLEEIARHGLGEVIEAPGFVASERVEEALSSALCMALPSRREGYGLIVVEASAKGVPSIVVQDQDNAAVDLVSEGENGFVAASASPADIAAAIELAHAGGPELRASTAEWFRRNARRLSIRTSLEKVLTAYSEASARR
jgi:glycosyltransferase involved in cell wall biosynthesis